MKKSIKLGWIIAAALASTTPAHAASSTCDRTCLRGVGEAVIASITRNAPADVPLADHYKATENGVPAALSMMTIWRTATAASHRFFAIDPTSGQLFLAVTLKEGRDHALLFGRLHVVDGKVDELELYVDRSRSDGGFVFDATKLGDLPSAWTQPVDRSRLPGREALLQAGRAMFDTRVVSPPPATGCVLIENGKTVAEDPEVLKAIMPPPAPGAPPAPPPALNADGTVSIPCGVPPDRPTDSQARTTILDEEQGVVVTFATVEGAVSPYLITTPTETAFVPDSFLPPYEALLAKQRAADGGRKPQFIQTRATVTVAQAHRIYDGKVQGMHLFEKLGPVGARSPWVAP